MQNPLTAGCQSGESICFPAKWINLWLLNLIVFSHLSIYFEFMAFFRDNKSIENYFTKVKIMFSFLKLKVHLSGFNIDNK